ncbi:hypothetical protein [Pseudomonas luteola]|uniref:DUF4376 domain-containing protein n=1 Tax=Pseudomonas luteola TaxID=47886 RepID=UPI00388F16C3
MWARIENGVVFELTDIDPKRRFHDSLTWEVCDESVAIGWRYEGGAFTAPAEETLEDRKSAKFVELDAACAAAIVSGFTSDALGETHTYPSKSTDQTNLTASFADALSALLEDDNSWRTPFWCMDSAGIWDMREHTAAQMTAVGKTGKAIILAYQQKNIALQKKVLAAKTAEEVAAITWATEVSI